jgi:CRISPR-associated protein Csm4
VKAFFLRPTGLISVEGGALGGCLPRSDTLSAALVSVWRHVSPGADIDTIAARPPFVVSSALPWIPLSGTREILYPVPPGFFDRAADRQPGERKRLKRAAYATAGLFSRILHEPDLDPTTFASLDRGALVTHVPGKETPKSYRFAGSRLRVSVDRLGDGPLEGLLFETSASELAPGCGMAVIAKVEPEAEMMFKAALRLLGLEGVGAERTAGQGGFEVESVEPFAGPGFGSGMRLLLSLYHPTREEVGAGVLSAGRYALLERGGWITAPGAGSLRRRPVRMLAEGSVVGEAGGLPMGDVVEVLEPRREVGLRFPVFRDGRALWIDFAAEGVGHER